MYMPPVIKKPEPLEKKGDDQLVFQIAEVAHFNLVEQRISLGKSPITKSFLDDDWKVRTGLSELDLSNTNFKDLPIAWQIERLKGARIAFREVKHRVDAGVVIDENEIEAIAEILHADWLIRNRDTADLEQVKYYKNMSESEKEKDRIFVRSAIETLTAKK